MSVQSRGAVALKIDGVTVPGPWRNYSGGDVNAEDVRIQPGHMLSSRSLGGTPSIENVTIRREYRLEEIHNLVAWLDSRVGSGAATVTRMFLDRDKKVYGAGVTRTGTLVAVRRPEYDAESSDVADLELEFSIDGP